jgi:hypothetical protein
MSSEQVGLRGKMSLFAGPRMATVSYALLLEVGHRLNNIHVWLLLQSFFCSVC